MKLRTILILTVIVFTFSNCQKDKNETAHNELNNYNNLSKVTDTNLVNNLTKERPYPIDNTNKLENTILSPHCTAKSINKTPPKEYIGECIGKFGKVTIYKEKNKKSTIIRRINNGEKVTLLETLPYGWFEVLLKDKTKGFVDARDIRTKDIPPHEYIEETEGYVLVYYEKDQKLKIFKDGILVLESTSSSGLWQSPTPKGIFQIEEDRRGHWGYVPAFNSGFKYWVGFKGNFLFHSIPFSEDMKLLEDEAAKLGEPASHGCIRLPIETSKYIYENIPKGSLVLIY